MAGFNHERGRSNNMVDAEARGMVTVGRWARRHGVSARAAVEVMRPDEAHHTGTGRRGKSRLTHVLPRELEPSAGQLEAMRAWDAGDRPAVRGWHSKWEVEYTGPYGRRRNVPVLGVYEGDPAKAPKGLEPLGDDDYAKAAKLAGQRLRAYAKRFDDVLA
ncbi:MAG: hypothetical protein ACE5HE_09170 [Phycisphaerae bacterium]